MFHIKFLAYSTGILLIMVSFWIGYYLYGSIKQEQIIKEDVTLRYIESQICTKYEGMHFSIGDDGTVYCSWSNEERAVDIFVPNIEDIDALRYDCGLDCMIHPEKSVLFRNNF